MSILFINSSPNPNGNTAKVAAALLEGKEYETLNLAEYKIYGYGQQFPDDQFFEVIDKIRAAKTIVIGSPLYWHNLSGLLRCFLDRTYGPFEQGEFSGRDMYAVVQGAAPEKQGYGDKPSGGGEEIEGGKMMLCEKDGRDLSLHLS